MAEQAGISMAEARRLKEEGGGSIQGIRDLIFDRNNEDQRAREQAVRSRNMLAGNDPRANLTNAYNTLSPEDQRAAMLGMMFPQGATPLDVEQAAAAAVREAPTAALAMKTNAGWPTPCRTLRTTFRKPKRKGLRTSRLRAGGGAADDRLDLLLRLHLGRSPTRLPECRQAPFR